MTEPRVAIVLVNWNGWMDTSRCLESIAELDYRSRETVVIDNGSTDGSPELLADSDFDVTLVRLPTNLGFAVGSNHGVQWAIERSAEYVWLLNNDTVVEPGSLSAMLELASDDSHLGAIGSTISVLGWPDRIQAWGGGRISTITGVSRLAVHPMEPSDLDFISAASMLIRRDAILTTGLMDEGFFMYWEDADYCRRLMGDGWQLGVATGSRVQHRLEGSSTGGRALDRMFNKSAVRYFRKHARVPAIPIILGTSGRIFKRLVRLEWGRVIAVIRGSLEGIWS